PRVDFTETDKNYVIKADLPGLDKKDVNISVQDDVLTISGERKNEREEKDDKRHLVERSYGKFSRSIRLPIDVQVDDAAASMEHGVLQI
ncbi:heat shock protein Hsp20, partial [Gaertneriomyces semiglobifer]